MSGAASLASGKPLASRDASANEEDSQPMSAMEDVQPESLASRDASDLRPEKLLQPMIAMEDMQRKAYETTIATHIRNPRAMVEAAEGWVCLLDNTTVIPESKDTEAVVAEIKKFIERAKNFERYWMAQLHAPLPGADYTYQLWCSLARLWSRLEGDVFKLKREGQAQVPCVPAVPCVPHDQAQCSRSMSSSMSSSSSNRNRKLKLRRSRRDYVSYGPYGPPYGPYGPPYGPYGPSADS